MEARGRLIDYGLTLERRLRLTFEVDQDPSVLDSIRDTDLKIKAVKYRKGRSLNANAYFHVLCDKIANATGSTPTEVKNQLLIDYGQFEYEEDGSLAYSIKKEGFPYLRSEVIHYFPTDKTAVLDNGILHRVFLIRRGSHTYNTAEMAALIDGTVNDAKELGIETATPDEIERMKKLWNPS